jgi:hypothetical protein
MLLAELVPAGVIRQHPTAPNKQGERIEGGSCLWYDGGKETYMIELTDEQRQRLADGQAVQVTDPETAQLYVVLRQVVYERLQRLLYDDAEWTEDELRLQLARSAKENGWDEPEMETYDRYDQQLRKRCP